LFIDEEAGDCHDSSDTGQSLIKDRQLNTRVEEMRRSMAGLRFTSSPILQNPDDLRQEEEGGSPTYKEAESGSFSSPSNKAYPTLAYSCSSREEGESERSNSLGKGKSDSFLPPSNEASPTVLDPLGGGDKEGKKRGTSLGKEEISTSREKGTLSSSASQHPAVRSDEERKMKSPPPVHMMNLSGHNSGSSNESDPENRVGDGSDSDGKAQGNGSSEAAAVAMGKEKEKARKEEEKDDDEPSAKPEPQFKVGYQYRTVERQLMQNEVSRTHFNYYN
jgi:hypothetical protein